MRPLEPRAPGLFEREFRERYREVFAPGVAIGAPARQTGSLSPRPPATTHGCTHECCRTMEVEATRHRMPRAVPMQLRSDPAPLRGRLPLHQERGSPRSSRSPHLRSSGNAEIPEALMLAIARDDSGAVSELIRQHRACLDHAFREALRQRSIGAMSRLIDAGAHLDLSHPNGLLAWEVAEMLDGPDAGPHQDPILDSLVATRADTLHRALIENPAAMLDGWLSGNFSARDLRRCGTFAANARSIAARIDMLTLRFGCTRQINDQSAGAWPQTVGMRLLLAWEMNVFSRHAWSSMEKRQGTVEFDLLRAGFDMANVQSLVKRRQAQQTLMMEVWHGQCAGAAAGVADFLFELLPVNLRGEVWPVVDYPYLVDQLRTGRGLTETVAVHVVRALDRSLLAASSSTRPVVTLIMRTRAILSWTITDVLDNCFLPHTMDHALAMAVQQACARPEVDAARLAFMHDPVQWLVDHEDGLLLRQEASEDLIADCLVISTGMPGALAALLASGWRSALDALLLGTLGLMEPEPEETRSLLATKIMPLSSLLANAVRRRSQEMLALQQKDSALAKRVDDMHLRLIEALDRHGLPVPATVFLGRSANGEPEIPRLASRKRKRSARS